MVVSDWAVMTVVMRKWATPAALIRRVFSF